MFSVIGTLLFRVPKVSEVRVRLVSVMRPLFRVVNISQGAALNLFGTVEQTKEEEFVHWKTRAAWSTARVNDLEREVNELRAMMSLDSLSQSSGTLSAVLANPSFMGGRSMLLNKGSLSGIEPGSVVLAVSGDTVGVVGRVSEVGPSMSRVTTILDPSSRIAAAIESSRGFVYAGPREGRQGRLDFLPKDLSVSVGDPIFTSSDGTLFPSGILIGKIARLKEGPTIFQDVEITPAVSLEETSYVWILSNIETS